MIAIVIPSCDSIEAALDYVGQHGHPIRVCLMRGADGKVRGNALVRRP